MRIAFAAIALIAVLPAAVSAAEVKQRAEIEGEISDVWKRIGAWCAIKDWHPAIAKCEESAEGGKTRRTLTTKDGGVIKETLTKTGAASYSYTIDESPLPVANYSATFSAVPDDDDQDEINIVWQAKFDAKGATDAEAVNVIKGIFKAGIDNIKKTVR